MTSSLSHVRVSPKVFSGYQFVRGLPAGRGGPYRITCRVIVVFFISSLAQWNTNSAKIASWIRRGIEAEGGCCCQPWGRVSLGVCGNDPGLPYLSPSKCPVLHLVPHRHTIALLSNGDRFAVWNTPTNGLGLEKRFDRRNQFGRTGKSVEFAP